MARWLSTERDPTVLELRSPTGIVARLAFDGDRVIAEAAAASWLLEQDVTRTIRVWDLVTSSLAAEVDAPSWTGHRGLTTSSGKRFAWSRVMPWRRRWRIRSSGRPVLDVEATAGGGGRVTIHSQDLGPNDLALAVLVGSYLFIRRL